MATANSEVTNGTPVVRIKDGETNMYILAEGALGVGPEAVLLADNSHVLNEINTDATLADTDQIPEELVAGNEKIVDEKMDQEKLEQEQILEQENALAAGPDNHSMYTTLPPFEYILHQSDVLKSTDGNLEENSAILSAKRMKSLKL